MKPPFSLLRALSVTVLFGVLLIGRSASAAEALHLRARWLSRETHQTQHPIRDSTYHEFVHLPLVAILEKYPADNRAFEMELLRLINEQRVLAALPVLAEQAALTQAARRHAIDMATHNLLSHTGSDGSEPEQRMVQEGYAGSPWGEAAGFSVSPERAMALAMGSDPHRGIILDPQARDVGIGFALRQGRSTFVIDIGH